VGSSGVFMPVEMALDKVWARRAPQLLEEPPLASA